SKSAHAEQAEDSHGAQSPLGRPDPVQGRHRRDPGHQKSRGPARRGIARPYNHRAQWPYQPARPWGDLAIAVGRLLRISKQQCQEKTAHSLATRSERIPPPLVLTQQALLMKSK